MTTISDSAIQALLRSSLKRMRQSFQDFLALGREQILAFRDSIQMLHVETTLESERDEQGVEKSMPTRSWMYRS